MQRSIHSKAMSLLLTLLLVVGVFATVNTASLTAWADELETVETEVTTEAEETVITEEVVTETTEEPETVEHVTDTEPTAAVEPVTAAAPLTAPVTLAAPAAAPYSTTVTAGSYTITVATPSCTENGITATATVGTNVYTAMAWNRVTQEREMCDLVDVTVAFSGTIADAGGLDVDLSGHSANTNDTRYLNGSFFYVKSGQSLSTMTITLNMTAYGDITDLELTMALDPYDVYTLQPPAPKTVNGVTLGIDFGQEAPYYNMGEGVTFYPAVTLDGTVAAKGTYTISLSSVKLGLSDPLVWTIPQTYNAGEVLADWWEIEGDGIDMVSHDVDDFVFNVTFNPTDGSSSNSSSKSSGGSSGGGSATPPPNVAKSANVSGDGSVNSTSAVNDLKKALNNATGDSATVTVKNADSVSPDTLKALAKAAASTGKHAVLQADTIAEDGSVQGRLYVDPAKLAGASENLKLGVSTEGARPAARKALFEKFFDNKVSVISCAQSGSFGAKLKIAAKVELPKNTENLTFYSFDSKTGKYTKIDTTYRIDKNGYVHFETELAGDIIISDKPLKKK